MTMQVIQHIELGSTQASIDFNSISQAFTDLVIQISVRNSGTSNANTRVRFNGDTGNNYSSRLLYGTGSGVASYSETTTSLYGGDHPASNWTASTFGNGTIYIPNYTSTTAKSISNDVVAEQNATASWQQISAHLWNQTSAITSISIFPFSGSWVAGSSATLYGITRGSDGITTVS